MAHCSLHMKLKLPRLLGGIFLFVCLGTLRLHADRVVSLACNEAAQPNFFNKDGLPAAPFRTALTEVTSD